jgi:hypothetical protein
MYLLSAVACNPKHSTPYSAFHIRAENIYEVYFHLNYVLNFKV